MSKSSNHVNLQFSDNRLCETSSAEDSLIHSYSGRQSLERRVANILCHLYAVPRK